MATTAFLLMAAAPSPADCLHPAPLSEVAHDRPVSRTGGVLRGADVCYIFIAHAGQHLTLSISSPDDNVVAAVYLPGVRVIPASDGPDIKGRTLPGAADLDDARSVRASLPASGSYLIVLGTMRGGGGQYRLRVQLR